MTASVAAGYSLRELSAAADRAQVLDLWRRNLPGAGEARYTWLYERGPALGWLLETDGGRCVGMAGIMQRKFHCGGVDATIGQAVDFNIDPGHRSGGPALKLQRAVTATVTAGRFPLLYAFPNDQSKPVLERVGYRPLGPFGRWVKLLRSEVRLQRCLRYPALTKVIAGAVDLGLRLTSRESRESAPKELRFDVINSFDDRFDQLWQRARGAMQFIGERTAEYLNWRFAQAPDIRHSALTMTDEAGRLSGYIVYCRQGNTILVGDLLADDTRRMEPLLGEFIRRMRWERAESVTLTFLGPTYIEDLLERFGFWRRPSDWTVLIHPPLASASRLGTSHPSAPRLGDMDAATVLDSTRWWLTRADVDTDA